MNEADYIQELQSMSQGLQYSPAAVMLADKAVEAFPESALLWCLRGVFICKCLNDCGYSIEDAVRCHEKAVELDPRCAEAMRSWRAIAKDFWRIG